MTDLNDMIVLLEILRAFFVECDFKLIMMFIIKF